MTWDIARTDTPCTSINCETVIGAGEQVRRMAGGRLAICVPCAKRRLQEDPPETMPAQSVMDAIRVANRWQSAGEAMKQIADDPRLRQLPPGDR